MSMYLSIGSTLQEMSSTHDVPARALPCRSVQAAPTTGRSARTLAAGLRRLASAELRWASHLERRVTDVSLAS